MKNRRLAPALVLLLLAAPARADEPFVALKGARTAPVGGVVMVDARDSKSDPDQPLQWNAVEPEDLIVATFDKGGREGVIGLFTLPKAGRYVVAVTAIGTVDKRVRVVTRLWTVTTEGAAPTPPDPGPGPTPTPAPDTPMAKVAKDFANGVLEAYAASWETNATVLASGQTAKAASEASEAKLRDLRMAAFRRSFGPEISRVLPEGTEVKDQAQRDAVTRMERDFAAALRGLKR